VAIEILTDKDTNQSVMFCNIDEIAFGPVFGEDEDPLEFLDWCNEGVGYQDVRRLSLDVLLESVEKWRKEAKENEAEASGERHFN